jgi:DNA-binding MarR family transcriptional regulator
VPDLSLKLGDEAETIPGFLLWQVSKLWQRRLTLALQDLQLASTQAVILANALRFSEEGRQVTHAMVSDAAKVDRMTTSQSLRSLQQKGYVTRVATPGDKRAYLITLTPEGRRVAFAAIERLATTHRAFFKPLENQTVEVVGYLQKLIEANEIHAD